MLGVCCIFNGEVNMTESLNYSLIKKDDNFELRLYPAHIKAEVHFTDKSYQRAIYDGFRVLAGYIFGGNMGASEISMTSPVQVTKSSQIAMTTPVLTEGDEDYSVAFIMPSEYTMETLPKPTDPDIRIVQSEEHYMAALRFSGYFSHAKVRKAQDRLKARLEDEKLSPIGDFIAARYDPPWVPWFMARNEVLIKVNRDPKLETGEGITSE